MGSGASVERPKGAPLTHYPLLTEKYGGNWRTVVGHPKYAVSDEGKVYTFKSSRLMTLCADKYKGYIHVMLAGKCRHVGILVAEAFVPGKTKERFMVDHKDRDKTNNHVANLRWVSHAESAANHIVPNKLGLPGVNMESSGNYRADILIGGVTINLGTYKKAEDAALAHAEAAVRFRPDHVADEIRDFWEKNKHRFADIVRITHGSKHGRNIHAATKGGFSVSIRGQYVGYRKTVEEAIIIRDEYLLAHPKVRVCKKRKRDEDTTTEASIEEIVSASAQEQ